MQKFGFEAIEDEKRLYLIGLNSELVPQRERYQGMGHYDILVKSKDSEKYAVIPFGGENGWTFTDNEKSYQEYNLNNLRLYDHVISEISKSWTIITDVHEFTGGLQQSIVRVSSEDP